MWLDFCSQADSNLSSLFSSSAAVAAVKADAVSMNGRMKRNGCLLSNAVVEEAAAAAVVVPAVSAANLHP